MKKYLYIGLWIALCNTQPLGAVRVSELPPAEPLDGDEMVPVVQEGVTVRSTVNSIRSGSVRVDDDGLVVTPVDFWLDNESDIATALGLTSAATGDASGLITGTLPDGRLSNNIPRLDANNSWSGNTTFSGPTTFFSPVWIQNPGPMYAGQLYVAEGDTLTWNGDQVAVMSPIIDVADNAAKLALGDIKAGQRVRITGEGNRIEVYLGESEGTEVESIEIADGESFVNGTWYPSEYTFNGEFFYSPTPEIDPEAIEAGDGLVKILYRPVNDWRMGHNDDESPTTFVAFYSANDTAEQPWDVEDWLNEWTVSTDVLDITPTYALVGPETEANWVTLISGGRRYPVFRIDIPYGAGFTDFELKGSTSNFTGASIEDKIVYYYHSPDPDLAQSIYDAKPLVWYTRSGPETIVHRQQPGNDSIYSTLPDADSEVGSIYIIVRGDDEWLYPGNPDLLWGYVLFDGIGPVEDGATPARQIWRAIRPVEWITPAEIPSFLDQ